MGKGALNHPNLYLQEYCWEEIRRHNTTKDRWIVIDGFVYDVSTWGKRHPGGDRIIRHHGGEDASEAWYAFHPDRDYVSKFMKTMVIGQVKDPTTSIGLPAIVSDFRKARKSAEDMGLFEPSRRFFVFTLGQCLVLEALAWLLLWTCGTGWPAYVATAVLLATSQAQAGWCQHDYGHLSVMPTSRLNHWMHIFIINVFKGASSCWWNQRHNNHHAKPNIIRKDPDIRFDHVFVVGKTLPKEWGKGRKGIMPFNLQHRYFFFIMPPLLLPLYFNFEIPYYMISRKQWAEVFWTFTFFVRWQFLFSGMLGYGGVFALFFFVRFLESHWFVWATQMSHLPCDVSYDKSDDWVTMQVKASCNIEGSWFNDWFSGHLNYQIEHHLFPSMPRHNLCKAVPLAKALCKKHNIPYICKPLMQGFTDIIKSLKESGEMWENAYNE